MNPIVIRALSKTYRLGFFYNRQVRALDGLDLEIEPGQVYGLVGPNGAGKSTTIKILMNLVQPTAGQATVLGARPSHASARRDVGYLPENPAPYEYLTGREFVELAARLSGVEHRSVKNRVGEVLEATGMTRHSGLQIRRYSKGMIQRICLAQAIVHRPKLLVLDEPTSGLDPMGRRQIRDLIFEERARGTTILFCTHIISDVEAVCDRIAVLVGGKRVREGSVNELVTADIPVVELTFENVTEPFAQDLAQAGAVQRIGARVMVRVPDTRAQELIQRSIAAGAKVFQVQPVRFSLEELFMQALSESKNRVGGELL